MKVNVKGELIDAVNVGGTGYADAETVLAALGIPTRRPLLGRLQVALRRLAEVAGQPHAFDVDSNTFHIGGLPVPPLPADPVGARVRPWHPVTPEIASGPGDRRAELLERVIRQFQVAVNPRYLANQQGLEETYCNIYSWDVTSALGAEIPHWVDGAGDSVPPGQGRELDANATVLWLRQHGYNHGWKPTSATGAALAASMGRPAVAAWFNVGGIGHIAVVRPGSADPQRGLPIAQAGARNFDDGYLVDGFGDRGDFVEFYVHS